MICFLIVLFQLIEYLTTLKEEIIYTIKKFINPNTKEIGDEFYSRLKFRENNIVPNFSLFFISSFFSELLLNYLIFPILTFFDFLFIGFILYFGLDTFDFVENKDYSFKQFVQLILYFIGIDCLLGLIALLPINY